MRKHLLVGLSSAAIMSFALGGGAYPQSTVTPPPAPPAQKTETTGPPVQQGPADNQIANEVDARIAQLKASLRLTADQEKSWPGLQSGLRDFGIAKFKTHADDGARRYGRGDREQQSHQADRPNDIELMRKSADDMSARAASLKTLANAAEPTYGTLDERQKQKLMNFMSAAFEIRRR